MATDQELKNDFNASEIPRTAADDSASRAPRSKNHSKVADARLRPYGRSRGATSRLSCRTRSQPQPRTILGQSLWVDLENEPEVSATSGLKPLVARPPWPRAAMFLFGHTRQNSHQLRLTVRGTLFKIDDGGSRKGSKGNAVHVLGGTLCRGCPRNCKRRVFGRHDHWDRKILGRWPNTATREPGHLPPATSYARTRWAGCPGVNVRVRPLRGCCPGRMAERATAKIAGDRLRFRR